MTFDLEALWLAARTAANRGAYQHVRVAFEMMERLCEGQHVE